MPSGCPENRVMCSDCRHCDRKTYPVPCCAHPRAYRPNGHLQACVIAFEKCLGKFRA